MKLVILGAGPAGMSLALDALDAYGRHLDVTVLEAEEAPGGMAGGFSREGLHFDYGSHRLHKAMGADMAAWLTGMHGIELLKRPRAGRIALGGRFVGFPLSPLDGLLHLPMGFKAGLVRDMLVIPWRRRPQAETFERLLRHGLGDTICERFYFPYARKIWGLEPDRIAAFQAHRRISSSQLGSLVRKTVWKLLPGGGGDFFYYPRRGFGSLAVAMQEEILRRGGRVLSSRRATGIESGGGMRVTCSSPGGAEVHTADLVCSTIPITDLVRMLAPPPLIRAAADSLRYRAMVLLYLVLDRDQFTPFDAHYTPDDSILFARMSEPGNYTVAGHSKRTGLCFEIPCSFGDTIWTASPDDLTRRIVHDLETLGLHMKDLVAAAFIRRLRHAYPLYEVDFERHLRRLTDFLDGISGVVTLGRQGLFLHDNVHHALIMGRSAAACLKPGGGWEDGSWKMHVAAFQKQVVED
ncbi:FAD-dependent oxidoreductase [bacterium]|nr:FAD-dependent oxidoreductase [candidate division CSSED10-310 bacterium]